MATSEMRYEGEALTFLLSHALDHVLAGDVVVHDDTIRWEELHCEPHSDYLTGVVRYEDGWLPLIEVGNKQTI